MQRLALDDGLVRKAMALRVKYRVSDKSTSIPLCRMGVHPANRGGVYPQPDTVRNLGLQIMSSGFNQSEANHEGVNVEEVPFCERADYSRSSGSPYVPYSNCNIGQCGHVFWQNGVLNALDIMHGTLSHCTSCSCYRVGLMVQSGRSKTSRT